MFDKRKKKNNKSVKSSPFQNSYARYMQFMAENNIEKLEMIKRMKQHDQNKLIEEADSEEALTSGRVVDKK